MTEKIVRFSLGPRKPRNECKKVRRVTAGTLDGSFGPDADKRIVLMFVPGDGKGIADVLKLRPYHARQWETVRVLDVYRFAIRSRVNAEVLARARARKEKHAIRLAAQRQARAEKRLTEMARIDCQ